ncbi:hypothetical protein MMC13_006757 [Lambiella insularis]|nr:hypothetical protein [Lambiella insularis]
MADYRDNEESLRARHRRSSSRQRGIVPREDDGEIVEQIYVHHRHDSHDAYDPRGRQETYDYGRRANRSASSHRRYSTFDEVNTEAMSPGAHRRHSSTREHAGVIPYYGTLDNEIQRRESRESRRSSHHSRHSSSDSRRSSSTDATYLSENEEEKAKKLRNKKLLYTGLAGITTIAAANNIYQSTKAHEARRKAKAENRDFSDAALADARKQRNKAVMLDLFSVGVAAVCVNNAVNGWKKAGAEHDNYVNFQKEKEEKQEIAQKLLAAPQVQKSLQQEIAWIEPNYRERGSSAYVR